MFLFEIKLINWNKNLKICWKKINAADLNILLILVNYFLIPMIGDFLFLSTFFFPFFCASSFHFFFRKEKGRCGKKKNISHLCVFFPLFFCGKKKDVVERKKFIIICAFSFHYFFVERKRTNRLDWFCDIRSKIRLIWL